MATFAPLLEKQAGVLDFLGNAAGQVGQALGLAQQPVPAEWQASWQALEEATTVQELDAAFQKLDQEIVKHVQDMGAQREKELTKRYQAKANQIAQKEQLGPALQQGMYGLGNLARQMGQQVHQRASNNRSIVLSAFAPILEKEAGLLDFIGLGQDKNLAPTPALTAFNIALQKFNNAGTADEANAAFGEVKNAATRYQQEELASLRAAAKKLYDERKKNFDEAWNREKSNLQNKPVTPGQQAAEPMTA